MADKFSKTGNGLGRVVISNDDPSVVNEEFDKLRYTNPDLYRSVHPTDRSFPEVSQRDYKLSIQDKDSILTTTVHLHDELSTIAEIP